MVSIPTQFPNLNPISILMAIPGVIIAVTLHEYTKSLVAYKLGDTNIKAQGRLAPNPLKHIDILGGIFLIVFGYGWANPVRLTPFSFKDRKKAMLFIFVMPFLVNIIVGAVFAIMASVFAINSLYLPDTFSFEAILTVHGILTLTAISNISFALFSLIPIYPLNGIHLLGAIKPVWAVKLSQYQNILQLVMAFFIILGFAAQVFHPIVLRMIWALSF